MSNDGGTLVLTVNIYPVIKRRGMHINLCLLAKFRFRLFEYTGQREKDNKI